MLMLLHKIIFQKNIIFYTAFFLLFHTNSIAADLAEEKRTHESPFGYLTSFYFPKRDAEKKKAIDFKWESGENIPFATAIDLGIGWERTTSPVVGWTFVQKDIDAVKDGIFNWSIPDAYLKQVPKELNLVVTINMGHRGLHPGTWTFANQRIAEKYGEFIQKLVERYDGDGIDDMPGLMSPVKHWQIENEPECNIKIKGGRPESGLDWKGFSRILKEASGAIKRADSTAKILSAGIVSGPPEKTDQIFDNFWKPLIEELDGNYIDIFDFHWYKKWDTSYSFYSRIRKTLNDNGFASIPIWMTENGMSSQFGEQQQAIDMVRRMIYPLSYGVEKVFWAWGLVEGWPPFDCMSFFNHTGLIYDGYCDGDLGYGIKKLAYYTYRQMTQIFSDKDLHNIKAVEIGEDNVYAYKISSAKQDVYIVWWAYEKDKRKSLSLTLQLPENGNYLLMETVPCFKAGQYIPNDGKNLFSSKNIIASNNILTFKLTHIPVYIIFNH